MGAVSRTQKIWRSLQELGKTVRSMPSESKTLKKAVLLSIVAATIYFIICVCFGNAIFEYLAPRNLLIGLGFYNPFWLLNIAIIISMVTLLVGAYRVSVTSFGVIATSSSASNEQNDNVKEESTAHSSTVPTEIKTFRARLAGFSMCVAINQKIWGSLQEHEDTVTNFPLKSKTMKKAALLSVGLAMLTYILSGCFGNATFRDLAPGNLLTGFGFYNPFWLLDIVILYSEVLLVAAYQVYHQPLFQFVDKYGARIFANSNIIYKEYHISLPTGFKPFKLNLFRLFLRTLFLIVTTTILMLIPFVNDIVYILGAFGFWPLAVYFPVEKYVVQKKIPEWSSRWVSLQFLCVACLIISTAAAAGSFSAVVRNLKVYRPFQPSY